MAKIFRYILLLILVQSITGLSISNAQSITSASGIVKDSVSGEPLPYVSVYFDGTTIGVMTDDNGMFSLKNDKGNTKLAAASLGYDTKFVNLKSGSKNDGLEIQQ